jgi:ABC-type dipeptide/oligopeptide/nickel transport system ATPase component
MGSTEKTFQKSPRPFSNILMNCLPCLDQEWEDVNIDQRAQQVEFSNACVYFERCPIADKKKPGCHEFRPKQFEVK